MGWGEGGNKVGPPMAPPITLHNPSKKGVELVKKEGNIDLDSCQ